MIIILFGTGCKKEGNHRAGRRPADAWFAFAVIIYKGFARAIGGSARFSPACIGPQYFLRGKGKGECNVHLRLAVQ